MKLGLFVRKAFSILENKRKWSLLDCAGKSVSRRAKKTPHALQEGALTFNQASVTPFTSSATGKALMKDFSVPLFFCNQVVKWIFSLYLYNFMLNCIFPLCCFFNALRVSRHDEQTALLQIDQVLEKYNGSLILFFFKL